MSVIGIIGSPRVNGNSETIVDSVLAGAKANGKEVKKYNLNKMNMVGCQACMGCKKNGTCIQKDGIKALLEDVKNAEAVILSTPLYFSQPTAQFRMFWDRCYSFMGMDFSPFIAGGKKLVTVVTCGSQEEAGGKVADNIEGMFAAMFKMVPSGKIVMAGGGPPTVAKENKDILNKAEAIGKAL
jgi:Multimeric flavodoxin WrbA